MEAALSGRYVLEAEFDSLDKDVRLGHGIVARYLGQHWRRKAERGQPAPSFVRPPAAGRLRVGVVLPVQPEDVGGGFTYERELLAGLLGRMSESPHEFVVIGNDHGDRRLPPNCRRLPLPFSVGSLHPAEACRRQTEFLHEHHLGVLLHLNPFLVLAPDIPYLTVAWDLAHWFQPFFPEVSADGEWEARQRHFEWSLPRATWVVTGTARGKSQIEWAYGVPAERVVVVPLPTPEDALAHEPRGATETAHRHGLTGPYLLYPAQFWPHKNHVTLLRALRVLRDVHGLRPLLALTGSDRGNRPHVQARAREMGVLEQVRFLDFVPRAVLLDLYARAAALAYPSLFGPDNLPPLEAFALGCPVVASRVAGAEEQLGGAALLVDPLDAGRWADALRAILTDEAQRVGLVEAGRLRAARWTRSDVGTEFLRLIDSFAVVRDLWR
jgi:glycosyltransferase involved in cell wall biosynthesis